MGMCIAGVDRADGQWLAVVADGGSITSCAAQSIETLWEDIDGADRLLIDVPIGLPDGRDPSSLERREAVDAWARSVSERPSSVFPVPSREATWCAAAGVPHEVTSAVNRSVLGKGLSVQSHAICPAIADVDWFLFRRALDGVVLEAHPEVCFRTLHGAPLQNAKHTSAGRSERLDIVETAAPRAWDVRALLEGDHPGGVDDLLDALVLTVTARQTDIVGLETYPTDSLGRPMRMVHAGARLGWPPTSRS